jgi:hypothetical protein
MTSTQRDWVTAGILAAVLQLLCFSSVFIFQTKWAENISVAATFVPGGIVILPFIFSHIHDFDTPLAVGSAILSWVFYMSAVRFVISFVRRKRSLRSETV